MNCAEPRTVLIEEAHHRILYRRRTSEPCRFAFSFCIAEGISRKFSRQTRFTRPAYSEKAVKQYQAIFKDHRIKQLFDQPLCLISFFPLKPIELWHHPTLWMKLSFNYGVMDKRVS
jgi:hypothetical protein